MKLKHCIMNKYKLINKATGEEHICEKVVIDGWDYYVSDETVGNYCWYINTYTNKLYHSSTLKPNENSKKVIATNNPSIDIPKVVEEVEELALKTTLHPKVLFDELKKCSQNDVLLIDEFGDYNIIRYRETTGFILGYNKSQETHPFSEEDMIEFTIWLNDTDKIIKQTKHIDFSKSDKEVAKELLQLWKEQRPKTLYYE